MFCGRLFCVPKCNIVYTFQGVFLYLVETKVNRTFRRPSLVSLLKDS